MLRVYKDSLIFTLYLQANCFSKARPQKSDSILHRLASSPCSVSATKSLEMSRTCKRPEKKK